MRIENPTALYRGDVVCCLKCNHRHYRVMKDIFAGYPLMADNFRPVGDNPTPCAGDVMLCLKCGEKLFTHGKFRSIERDAQSYLENYSGKDGLEEA